jgi:hypothetical protein
MSNIRTVTEYTEKHRVAQRKISERESGRPGEEGN